jgi:RNAse (barnase) inhibitor barstar
VSRIAPQDPWEIEMKTIEVLFSIFKSESTFHTAFAEIMGFPGSYGHNWDAWIDCMSYLDDFATGMTQVSLKENEQLELKIFGYEFAEELDKSDVFRHFCICSGFVNSRFAERQSETRLIISN